MSRCRVGRQPMIRQRRRTLGTGVYHGRVFHLGVLELEFGITKNRVIFKATEQCPSADG